DYYCAICHNSAYIF
nr:immunoglobulin light chain junction region [Macaca mulatta]MOW03455.1 immunoglobulin light chain junction region [Macaca mulatta]